MRSLSAAAVLALTTLPPACGEAPSSESGVLVVTVFPVADLTSRLVGPALPVRTLLPPRASPATWEATPAQVRALHGARGVISVGAGLDDWVEALVPSKEAVRHLRVTDGMALRETAHAHAQGEAHLEGEPDSGRAEGDPHIWLDPLLVRDQVLPRLVGFLTPLLPDKGEALTRRAQALADSLTALDLEIRERLARAPGRSFVATHEAWGYFARAYDLTSAGSVYERPGHEPSARGLAGLVEAARAAGLTTVLAEPQLAATAAEALAAELGGDVTVVDPLGGPGLPGREGYFAMMRFNARAFSRALGGP